MIPDHLDPDRVAEATARVRASSLADRLFAGHFHLGPAPRLLTDAWASVEIGGRHLSYHRDLSVTRAGDVTLIGDAYSWRDPQADNAAVLAALKGDLPAATAGLSGRWVMIAGDRVWGDAWGSLPVAFGDGRVASSPKLIGGDLDADFLREVMPRHRGRTSGLQFPGDLTPFAGVRALLPNHLLRLGDMGVERFWPLTPLRTGRIEDRQDEAADMFRGMITAKAHRAPLVFGLTGGTDSRLVFSAAHAVDADFRTYTGTYANMISQDHFDVRLSQEIAQSVGREHDVLSSGDTIALEVEDLFLAASSMRNWTAQKQGEMLLGKYPGRLHLVGWGSEINRRFWNVPDRDDPYMSDLLGCLGYPGNPWVAERIAPWARDLARLQDDLGYGAVDMLYWEGRMSRWAADSLTDISLCVPSQASFDCREWFDLVLGATQAKRDRAKRFYHAMTTALEPRVADLPINPTPASFRLRRLLPKVVPRTRRAVLKGLGLYGRIKARRQLADLRPKGRTR